MGFSASDAAKAVGTGSSAKFMGSDVVNEAIREFMSFVLADRADKLENKIVDVLWRRAFYDPMEFIDEDGTAKIQYRQLQRSSWPECGGY